MLTHIQFRTFIILFHSLSILYHTLLSLIHIQGHICLSIYSFISLYIPPLLPTYSSSIFTNSSPPTHFSLRILEKDRSHSVLRRSKKVTDSENKNLMAPRNFGSQITALVVDDNVLNQMIHQKLLESVGVRNQVVKNGKEAVDIHCHGQRFDLILMDMDMPIMNGIEATKELRSMGIGSMIVGVSSRCPETEIRKFMESGLNDYHEKPLNTAKLNSILDKMNPNFTSNNK